ncbi:MerR family transcriptional regulator [Streptomyces sp. NPDC056049]|uniref:helix-turn-helix domain-containing protein n=1 Tax=Streptomyces sp. NPDC056049 TaxID=3345693 RepID=UPI0035E218C8
MKSSEQRELGGGERDSMGIGALAERFGLATHVLRHWESTGLLAPARDAAGRRRYRSADLTRVAVILRAKDAGLSLDVIRSLTAPADAVKRRNILRAEADALRSRIAAAQASLDLIECALDCDQDDFSRCAHFRRAVEDGSEDGRPESDASLPGTPDPSLTAPDRGTNPGIIAVAGA